MPRRARIAPGGCIYHVINRANGRDILFNGPACYRDFLRLVAECAELDRMRILAYCAMPNHWHMLLWPREDGDLSRFVRRLSIRHAQRWHARNRTTGRGHIYQARFKSHVVETEAYLLTVCRYIERNPVRAHLVEVPSGWRWSSAIDHLRASGGFAFTEQEAARPIRLEQLPVDLPENWAAWLGEPESEMELERIRRSAASGTPLGDQDWMESMKREHGFPGEPRPAGRRSRREVDTTPVTPSADPPARARSTATGSRRR